MIYRLIKVEHSSWKPGFVVLAILNAILFRLALTGHVTAMVMGATCVSVLGSRNTQRCTVFEAALPIHGRDIFCARLFTNLAGGWLALLTIIAAIETSHQAAKGQLVVFVFEAAAIMALGAIAIRSVRIRQFNIPQGWKWVIANAALGVLAIASDEPDHAAMVLTICILANAAWFWKVWVLVPESYETAPRELVPPKSRQKRFSLPSLPWTPGLRTLFSAGPIGLLCVPLAWCGMRPMPSVGIFLVWIAILATILRVRQTGGWLLSLPISRQKLFLPMVLVPLAFFTLGSMIRFDYSRKTARATIIDLMAVAAMSLLSVAACEIPSLARRLRTMRYLLAATAVVALGYIVWQWFSPVTGTNGMRTTPVDVWLGDILPVHLPPLVITAVAVVGAFYWLAYMGFSQTEVRR